MRIVRKKHKNEFKSIYIQNYITKIVKSLPYGVSKDIELKNTEVLKRFEEFKVRGYSVTVTSVKSGFGYLFFFICNGCGKRFKYLYSPPEESKYWCLHCHDINPKNSSTSKIINIRYVKVLNRVQEIQEILLKETVTMDYRLKLESELKSLEISLPQTLLALLKKI